MISMKNVSYVKDVKVKYFLGLLRFHVICWKNSQFKIQLIQEKHEG